MSKESWVFNQTFLKRKFDQRTLFQPFCDAQRNKKGRRGFEPVKGSVILLAP
jgi:hypothetical protein